MPTKCCCHSHEETPLKVESIVLDDGRRAERRTTLDEQGNEVVEVFAEEKRPLKLEKRIVREMKNVVSKETHEVIRDGEVTYQEVRSLEADVPLQVRAKVGVADHAKIVDGDYVRKDEVGKLITDSVVAGVSALIDHMEPMTQNVVHEPVLKAQDIVEKNVEVKNNKEMKINLVMVGILVVQIAFLAYIFLA